MISPENNSPHMTKHSCMTISISSIGVISYILNFLELHSSALAFSYYHLPNRRATDSNIPLQELFESKMILVATVAVLNIHPLCGGLLNDEACTPG